MGLKDPVGTTITLFGAKGTIIGVVNDFNVRSIHQSISPVILNVNESLNFGTILVRTHPGQTAEAILSMQKIYSSLNPRHVFEYSFLTDQYERLYKSEQIVRVLSNIFGMLSIIISCLGLLGLTMFTAEQRVKEMSIRKVLGARIDQIFGLFSIDFVKLIMISIGLATPLAWFVMKTWLETFAYHINLSWWIFASAGGIALLLTFITIGSQAMKTAMTNPANTLRSE